MLTMRSHPVFHLWNFPRKNIILLQFKTEMEYEFFSIVVVVDNYANF